MDPMIVEGPSELHQFINFFDLMGVAYSRWVPDSQDEEIITVAQAHFHFEPNGEYAKVVDDEMGRTFPRRPAK